MGGGVGASGRACLSDLQSAEPAVPETVRRRLLPTSLAAVTFSIEPDTIPRAAIIATGSEIGLAVEAQKALAQAGVAVRVVSMPSTSVFSTGNRRPIGIRCCPWIFPVSRLRLAPRTCGRKYVGRNGEVIGMTTFGESAPAGELFKHFGFTVGHVVEAVKSLVICAARLQPVCRLSSAWRRAVLLAGACRASCRSGRRWWPRGPRP